MRLSSLRRHLLASCILVPAGFLAAPAQAQSLSYAPTNDADAIFQPLLQRSAPSAPTTRPAARGSIQKHLRRQIVDYRTEHAPGTIVVDTPNTYLYYVLDGGKAVRYGVGVGREGFTWSGVKTVGRKAEWPDWTPPEEMIARQPYLPRWVAGGPGNPLGARAMYLAGTVYRIHGTNAPSSIGRHMSSGCIRMLNEDVIDLYQRVKVGTKVVVLPDAPRSKSAAGRTAARRSAMASRGSTAAN
jgi:lipoprotein-anchoring transpeptidase ErfK/SrfK